MTLWIATILLVSLAGGGWLAAETLRRAPEATVETLHRSAIGRVVMALCLVGVAIVGLFVLSHVSDRVAQTLPLLFQRYAELLIWAGVVIIFGFLSGYVCVVALRTQYRQSRLLLLATGLCNVGFLVLCVRFQSPVAHELVARRTEDGVILQSSDASCAAATLANVASRFGLQRTEAELARLLGTTSFGSTPGQMRYALAELGIEYRTLNCRTPRLGEVRTPAVLFVDHPSVGSEGHAVGYFGRVGELYEIWDPLVGKVLWSEPKSRERWHGNGIECLSRAP